MDSQQAAQLIQQMQQMQQQLAQQQQHQQQLQAQLASAQAAASAQAVAAPVAAPAVGGKSFVKPRPPSTFVAADRVGELDQWEREMRYQFAAYGAPLASEQARIAFAVSYLGPVPLQWWDANPAHQTVQTWEEFVRLLRARFRPVHAAKHARTELFRIKQAPSQSAGAYAAAFQELLVSLPDMHVDDAVFLFVRGLSPALKRRVGDKEFATLSAAINAAVSSEGLYGVQLADEPPAQAAAAGHSMDLNALNAMYESNPERTREAYKWGQLLADNVDLKEQLYQLRAAAAGGAGAAAAGKSERISGLSKQQLDERLRGGLCLRCGSSDHYKNDCPRVQ
jgi:cell division septum initiation protein DivIVA